MPDARTCRSWLFVPGDSERKLDKCWDAGADAIIVDLEDAVPPERKRHARTVARDAIAAAGHRREGTLVVIRVNDLSTALAEDDLAETFGCRPDAYMIPKVQTPGDVRALARVLDVLEQDDGQERGAIRLVPIVTETPAPVFRLPELCGSDPRISAILWGTEDLGAAIGARRVKRDDGVMLDVFRTVRSLALLAGSAAGIGTIDTPVIDFSDDDGLQRESLEASRMGFTGKLAIHPRQVPIINAAFLPDASEVEDARAIVDGARAHGEGAFRIGNRMIDVPHIRAAERLLALAGRRGRAD